MNYINNKKKKYVFNILNKKVYTYIFYQIIICNVGEYCIVRIMYYYFRFIF